MEPEEPSETKKVKVVLKKIENTLKDYYDILLEKKANDTQSRNLFAKFIRLDKGYPAMLAIEEKISKDNFIELIFITHQPGKMYDIITEKTPETFSLQREHLILHLDFEAKFNLAMEALEKEISKEDFVKQFKPTRKK